jgi:cytochrome c biogenesis protein CcmG, thiol:disulfide interchange protein DsbE
LLPGIEALNDKYAAEGLKIIAVNIKEDWKPAVYWKNHEYNFDAVLEGDVVAEMYGAMGTPGIVFIAPSGAVLKVAHFSEPNHPSIEKFAQHFLK